MRSQPQRPHDDAVIERLRRDPELAAVYLDEILEDGDEGELLCALQRIAKAQGGIADVADQSELNRKSLYRALPSNGNPQMRTLVAVLKTLGLRLSIAPLTVSKRSGAIASSTDSLSARGSRRTPRPRSRP